MTNLIRPAGSEDINAICSLLHTKMNNRIPVDRWRKLMTYHWLNDKPDFGRVVESDGQILGFCGMVYADRMVGITTAGRRKERIVSMSSWYLDKSLRGKGLGRDMLIASISDPMLTYATLTNSPRPLAIQEAVGLRVLEDHRHLWKKTSTSKPSLDLIDNLEIITARVEDYERTLLADMAEQPVVPCLLTVNDKQTLMFFSIKRKAADILWFDLMYAGDLALFSAHAQKLANALLPAGPAVLAADGRFVQPEREDAIRESLPVARYFKSERVAAHEIDHLYSELQLLDLKLD